jgi:hypothetical protein
VPRLRGGTDAGKHAGMLSVTPLQCLLIAGEGQRPALRRRRIERNAAAAGREQLAGGVGGVQVPGEHPPVRGRAVRGAFVGGSTFSRVGAQQVMEPVPAGRRLLQQMRTGQGFQESLRLG